MKELYKKLRMLISDNFQITIIDKDFRNYAMVSISPCNGSHPWTQFEGKTIENALERAIHQFKHPDEDYVQLDGHVWKANEESCYFIEHIKGFLKKRRNHCEC
jgi:hypothetical protein